MIHNKKITNVIKLRPISFPLFNFNKFIQEISNTSFQSFDYFGRSLKHFKNEAKNKNKQQ